MKTGVIATLGLCGLLALGGAAQAQPKFKDFDELARYRGPDRQKILLEGAKKEGVVVYYTAYVKVLVDKYLEAWAKTYPDVKLDVTIGSDPAISTRIITEFQGGLNAVDVISTSGSTKLIYDATGTGTLSSPLLDAYPVGDTGRSPDGKFVSITFSPYSLTYNTNRVKPEDVPKEWEDLLKPRWKGKFVTTTAPTSLPMLTGGLIAELGRERTVAFLAKLAKQDITILPVAVSAIAGMVAAGDYDICFCAPQNVTPLQKAGAPLKYVLPGNTTIAQVHNLQMPIKPAHPYAALLLVDFLLSAEGGPLVQQQTGYYPTNPTLLSQSKEFAGRKNWIFTPQLYDEKGAEWRQMIKDAGINY